jgi:hypothetical protein
LRLAGVEVAANPACYAYQRTIWHYHSQAQLKKPLRDVIEHRQETTTSSSVWPATP